MPIDATIIPTKQQIPDFGGATAKLLDLQNANQQYQTQLLQQQKLQQEVNANQPALTAEQTRSSIANLNLETLAKQNEFLNKSLSGLKTLANQGKLKFDDVRSALSNAVANHQLTAEQAQIELNDYQSVKDDPQGLADKIDQHYTQSLSNADRINALMPKLNYVDTGNGVTITKTNPLTGQTNIQGVIPKNLSPSELASTVTIKTPEGKEEVITKAQLLNMVNNNGGSWNGAMPKTESGYTGRYPNAEQKSPVLGEHGGVLSGAGTESAAAQSALGTSQASAIQSLHNQVKDAPLRISLLEKARQIVGEGTQTGPGTEWRNTARSFIGALSPEIAEKIGGKDFNADTAKYEEFRKIMTNYANNVSGAGTNDRLAAAMTGNANQHIQNLANQDILTMTVAAEKMQAAKDRAWQNLGKEPSKFNAWESDFNNKKMLPEAFVYESMTAPQQKSFIERLSKSGKLPEFKKAFTTYVREGLIEMPKGQ